MKNLVSNLLFFMMLLNCIVSKPLFAQDTLFIAMYRDFAPFTFINAEGQPAGLFMDIWKLWAEKTGRKIEFRAGSWNDWR